MKQTDRRMPVGYNFAMAHVGYQGDDCVIWPYSCCTPGYGTFSYHRVVHLAHRFMCEQANGAPPTVRHHAAHSCGNRRCINPKHLDWKTPSENQKDRKLHGTNNKLTRRITKRQAEQIRSLKGIETSIETAARYGVTESNIRLIQDGSTWRDERKIHYFQPDQDEAIRVGAQQGKSWEQIALQVGRTEAAVYGRACRLRLVKKGRTFLPAELADIRATTGWGHAARMAAKYGVNRNTIYRVLQGRTYRSVRRPDNHPAH